MHFSELNVDSLAAAVEDFLGRQQEFTVDNCTSQAEKFSLERFELDFSDQLSTLGIAVQTRPNSGANLAESVLSNQVGLKKSSG